MSTQQWENREKELDAEELSAAPRSENLPHSVVLSADAALLSLKIRDGRIQSEQQLRQSAKAYEITDAELRELSAQLTIATQIRAIITRQGERMLYLLRMGDTVEVAVQGEFAEAVEAGIQAARLDKVKVRPLTQAEYEALERRAADTVAL